MSSTRTYPYEDPIHYSFDSDLIKLENGKASLKLIPLPEQSFSEDYSSDTGFTYDNTKSEFAGGKLQQIDLHDGASFTINFNNGVEGNSGDGELTTVLQGSASITGGILDVTQSDDSRLEIDAVGKINASKGSARFCFIPSYNDKPNGFNNSFFYTTSALGSNNDLMYLTNDVLGRITMYSRSSTGVLLQNNVSFGVISLVQDHEYDIAFSWDFITGRHELFIDGVKFGSTLTETGTRSNDTTSVTYASLGYQFKNLCKFCGLTLFSDVKYTSAPPVPFVIPDNRYEEDYVLAPVETAGGSPDGTLVSIEAFDVVGTSNVKFTFNNADGEAFWYTAGAWAVSDKTYSQSNTAEDLLAYLSEFPFPPATTQFIYGIVFPTGFETQGNIDQLDVEYTHQEYPRAAPSIAVCSTCKVWSEEMFTFIAVDELPANTDVRYILSVSGTKTYWDGAAWVPSNDTLAQSNTAAEVAANIATIIDARKQVGFDVKLSTTDGLLSPSLDSVTITYDQALADPDSLPRLVDINGYIYDNDGPVSGLKIQVRPYRAGFSNPNTNSGGGVFHAYVWRELATTLDDGYFSGGVYLQSDGNFWEFKIGTQSYRTKLIDKDSNDFNELTITLVED